MSPADIEAPPAISARERARSIWQKYKWFTIIVIAPVLIAALYLYAMASDQYVSEAHYLVRSGSSSSSSAPPSTGIGGMLGGSGGSSASMAAAGESMSVSDYLESHDVVRALQKSLNIVTLFRRPEADALSRLSVDNPTPELLQKYYLKQVDVEYDIDTGITTLKARAFRPGDAHAIALQLLQFGERRVNDMNARAYTDAVSLSKRQLDEAETALKKGGVNVTSFRQSERDADPITSTSAQISLVSGLRLQLSAARAQLQTTIQLIGADNPQTEALRQQVRSLEQQLASQSSRLAGGGNAIAADLGNYEGLQMQQQFLQQRYTSASTAYDSARQNAVRQQLYVVRVVEPNMPVKSIYPQRGLALITLFAALTIIYAIGWLIMAGVREHSV